MISSCFRTIRRSSQCILVIPIRTKLSYFHLLCRVTKSRNKIKPRHELGFITVSRIIAWSGSLLFQLVVRFYSSQAIKNCSKKTNTIHGIITQERNQKKKLFQEKCQVKAPVCCIVHNLSQLNTSNWFKQQGEMIFIQNEEKT